MAAAADESIKLSIDETNGFINLSRGKIQKGRNEERRDGAAESPDPSCERVADQMGETQLDKQSISVAWKNVTKNLRQICQIIWILLHTLYIFCSEVYLIVCNLLMLLLKCCNCIKWSCKLIIAVWSIKLSINETNVINLSRGKIQKGGNEERSDGAAESPDPMNGSSERVTNQKGGVQSYTPSISVVWRNVTMNLWQICQIIWKLLQNLHICCSEIYLIVCNLLLLLLKCCHFIKWSCKLIIVIPLQLVHQTPLSLFLSFLRKYNFCQEPTLEGIYDDGDDDDIFCKDEWKTSDNLPEDDQEEGGEAETATTTSTPHSIQECQDRVEELFHPSTPAAISWMPHVSQHGTAIQPLPRLQADQNILTYAQSFALDEWYISDQRQLHAAAQNVAPSPLPPQPHYTGYMSSEIGHGSESAYNRGHEHFHDPHYNHSPPNQPRPP